MATFLDIGLMSYASKIFTFLLVFAIMFGLLKQKKVLGDKSAGLQGLIAFVIAVMAILSPASSAFINFITPWFFILVLVAFLILMVMFMQVLLNIIFILDIDSYSGIISISHLSSNLVKAIE